MFKLTSLNLNGIRSAAGKGLGEWLLAQRPDCICVQEVKAQMPDVAGRFETLAGMRGYFHLASVKKGYSGVGIYTLHEPSEVLTGYGSEEFDAEGRYVELRFDTPARKFSIISSYFPSGSSGEERQAANFRFLEGFLPFLKRLKSGREFILCGDLNIAHQEIDLKNWKGNQKNSGFLPEEREWIGKVIHTLGWTDMWRTLYPDNPGYTWWSNRGQAYAKDVGWRIDYQMVTPELAAKAVSAHVYKDEKFSDHAPLVVEYDYAAQ